VRRAEVASCLKLGAEQMGSRHVIIASDEPAFTQILVGALSAARCDVRAFHSKQDALASMKSRLPHLVVSEIHSKDRDGLTSLQLLRDDPRTSSAPVTIETGFRGEGMEKEVR